MNKQKKRGLEEWLIIGCILAIILIFAYFLTACAKSQQIEDMDILWSSDGDGNCIFHAKGMSIEQAEQIKNHWNFVDCEVKVDDSEDQTRE